jgi:hypothetical protein
MRSVEDTHVIKKSTRRIKTKARKFEVRAALTNASLTKAKSALTLEIFSRKEKLGELQIGRGSLYWWGAHRQRAKRINWERFAERMDKLAYGRDD